MTSEGVDRCTSDTLRDGWSTAETVLKLGTSWKTVDDRVEADKKKASVGARVLLVCHKAGKETTPLKNFM